MNLKVLALLNACRSERLHKFSKAFFIYTTMENFICVNCSKELYYSKIKERFIDIYKSSYFLNISVLCKKLGISRKTGYKYINELKKTNPNLIKKKLPISINKQLVIGLYKSNQNFNVLLLSKELGISRKTIYKYINSIK